MSEFRSEEFPSLYAGFHAPITELNCGEKCAPYNERGVPFCCDTRHAVPVAFRPEWEHLQAHTNLWHLWQGDNPQQKRSLEAQVPDDQVLVACLGHKLCQRNFRTITCRSFPFFPYIDGSDNFIGLTYYWEYEDRCWVISNLQIVSRQYRAEFIATFDRLFERLPEEKESFRYQSLLIRQYFERSRRAIPLLHRDGRTYKISPRSGRMIQVSVEKLPKFGPYKIAAEMPFPDELASG
jgi:hypothetical protein